MLWFFVVAAAIWGIAYAMKIPRAIAWGIIGIAYVSIVIAQLVLPDSNSLRATLGGTPASWGLLGGLVGLIWAYREVLVVLKRRAAPLAQNEKTATFSDTELDRYARHIVLREIGGPGQKRLKNAKVLVIGAGGLGSPALLYMAAAGIGTIGVIDDDSVENSNLQRQVIHTDTRIGMPKVFSAQAAMEAQNPSIIVQPYHRRLDEADAVEIFADYDLILDGTDNFETRYLVNRTCVALKKPLISAALTQWEGQISTYYPAKCAPCYCCIFPKAPAAELAPSCAEAGVVGPLPGIVGSMMALEAVKEITGAGEGLRGRMLIYDALFGESRMLKLKRRNDCVICGDEASK